MKSVLAIDQSTQGLRWQHQLLGRGSYMAQRRSEIDKFSCRSRVIGRESEHFGQDLSCSRVQRSRGALLVGKFERGDNRNVAIDGQGGDSPGGFKLDLPSDKRRFSCDEEGFGA